MIDASLDGLLMLLERKQSMVWLFRRGRRGLLIKSDDLTAATAVAIEELGGALSHAPSLQPEHAWPSEGPFSEWPYLHVTMAE